MNYGLGFQVASHEILGAIAALLSQVLTSCLFKAFSWDILVKSDRLFTMGSCPEAVPK